MTPRGWEGTITWFQLRTSASRTCWRFYFHLRTFHRCRRAPGLTWWRWRGGWLQGPPGLVPSLQHRCPPDWSHRKLLSAETGRESSLRSVQVLQRDLMSDQNQSKGSKTSKLWRMASAMTTCPSTSAHAPGTLSFPRIQLWIASADWFQSICTQVIQRDGEFRGVMGAKNTNY